MSHDRQRSLDIPMGPTAELRERMAKRKEEMRRQRYSALRNRDPEQFAKCVRAAEGILINNRLEEKLGAADALHVGAEIEDALVALALDVMLP